MHYKLLGVRLRVTSHVSRTGVKEGKDGYFDDQVDVRCLPERRRLGVDGSVDVMRRGRPRCHVYVERKDDADYVKVNTRLMAEGKAPVGRPMKTWSNTLSADIRLVKVDSSDVHDRKKWSPLGWHNAYTAASGAPP